jgi:hypothetical protein
MNQSATHELVRVQRIDDLEALVCRVFLSTNDCIIAAELSDSLDLDGLCFIPTRFVRCFDRAFERADFYRAALGTWGEINPHAGLLGELSCNLVQDLHMIAMKMIPVAIHMELDDPDVCYVGTIQAVSETELTLNRISSRGRRISDPLRIELDSITKVELATRYLTAVGFAARALAGPPNGS